MEYLLKQYYELLMQWNKHINLTALRSEADFRNKHVDDSLSILPYIENAKTVIDLGCGAGFPGIILKIARPDLQVTLLDSTRKKISFCDEVIRKLGLIEIYTVWGRAEDTELSKSLRRFDLVTSRATWKLSEFVAIAHRYISDTGKCIAMKGPKWVRELKESETKLKDGFLSLKGVHTYKLSDGEDRCLLEFDRKN